MKIMFDVHDNHISFHFKSSVYLLDSYIFKSGYPSLQYILVYKSKAL